MPVYLMPRSSSLVTILALSLSIDLTHTFKTSLSSEGAKYARLLPSGDTYKTGTTAGVQLMKQVLHVGV